MVQYRECDKSTADSAAVPEVPAMTSWQKIVANYDAELGDGMGTFTRQPMQQSVQEEFSMYTVGASLGSNFDTLGFWKVRFLQFTLTSILIYCRQTNEHTFPTIFRIAMDYLPIQASAVLCERVFSSSTETDTKKRNRIKPELMEALQVLKFTLKKDRLDFTAHLCLPEYPSISDGSNTLKDMLNLKPDAFKVFLDDMNFDD